MNSHYNLFLYLYYSVDFSLFFNVHPCFVKMSNFDQHFSGLKKCQLAYHDIKLLYANLTEDGPECSVEDKNRGLVDGTQSRDAPQKM